MPGTTPAADTDWFDETTRTGVVQNYNVAVSSGSDRHASYFSLGYYKNLGIIKSSDFDRYSARMNTEYKLIKDVLTIGEHFTLNRTSEVQAPGGFLENVLQFNPSLPVYTEKGDYAGPVGGYPDRENPVARLHRNSDNRYIYWRTFGDAYVNLHQPPLNFRSGLCSEAAAFLHLSCHGRKRGQSQERRRGEAGTLDEMDVECRCDL